MLLMTGTLLLLATALCPAIQAQEADPLMFELPSNAKGSHYIKILHVEPTFMLLGTRNHYYNVSTKTMRQSKAYTWTPNEDEISFCNTDLQKYNHDCDSYVVSSYKVNSSSYVVCASSAKKPACRRLTMTESGEWPTAVEPVNHPPKPLVPIFPWNDMRKLTADNGAMYVVGDYMQDSTIWCPQLYRDNVYFPNGTIKVPGLRSSCTSALFAIDFQAQKPLRYANIFETNDYVYFTFAEPALETYNNIGSQPTTYSRIARVCKNDVGQGKNYGKDFNSEFKFSTLFKARLICEKPGVNKPLSDSYLRQAYNGYFSTRVDEIVDATEPHITPITGADGEPVILAIFNSPRLAAKTSAICAFKVSDIDRLFDTTRRQVVFGSEYETSIHTAERPPAACYAKNETLSTTDAQSVNYYLLDGSVKSLNGKALFMSTVDYRMTHMQVDWQVEAADGRKYDIIFVSTDDGRLLKFVKEGEADSYNMVEERDIFPGKFIHEMKLIRDDTGKKHLLLNTYDQVKRVSIEKCHFYEDCSSCIGLRDPYCYWSPSHAKCVSTTHEASDKYQNITYGVSEQCIQPTTSTVTFKQTETKPTKSLEIFEEPVAGESRTAGKSTNTALITLLVILPIAIGGLGFLGGFLYSKRKYANPTHHLDELTHKSKDDMLKCEGYQTLPGKQSNLQLMNNLNGKVPNGETTSTLNRQKQVYV